MVSRDICRADADVPDPPCLPIPLQTVADVGSGIGFSGNTNFVDGVQKAVFRVPIDSMAVPKPLHLQPLPVVVAKGIAGFVAGGWLGMLRTLLFAR